MTTASRPLQPAAAPATRARWDARVPAPLRPLLRAYVLGYASAVVPRLLALLLQQATKRKKTQATDATALPAPAPRSLLGMLRRILREGLDLRRFPAFCAAVVGGSTLLEILIRRLLSRRASSVPDKNRQRLSRWLATFIAAWSGLKLLQSKPSQAFTETVPVKSDEPPGVKYQTTKYAGRTLDLTLFALTRALDVIVGEAWARRRARRVAGQRWTKMESVVSELADPSMFAVSCAFIMWAWFYYPDRLPRAYTKWIGSAAAVDGRLIAALQRCRSKELRYGEDTGQAPLLQGMCEDFGWPLEWGDPAKSIPFPCELVHMGCGPSCEYHALARFGRSFRWALATYLPLNLLLAARRPSRQKLRAAVASAARSSAFLGAFVALFYYGVCLARTRLGPPLVGGDAAARNRLDGGVCVGAGCLACGWSVLLEAPRRRQDLALFVAPRALATLVPRRYALDRQWRETAVFAASTAVVFTCALENPQRVRGVLGRVLATVLTP